MTVMPVFREPPPAGSDSGLRPSQGQSRFRNTGITFLISNIGTVEVFGLPSLSISVVIGYGES